MSVDVAPTLVARAATCFVTRSGTCVPAWQIEYAGLSLAVAILILVVSSVSLTLRINRVAKRTGLLVKEIIDESRLMQNKRWPVRRVARFYIVVALVVSAVAGFASGVFTIALVSFSACTCIGVLLNSIYAEILLRRWRSNRDLH
jgi:hypothetical protein